MRQSEHRDEHGEARVVVDRLLDHRDQITKCSAPEAHHDELRAEDDGGIGLAAVHPDFQSIRCPLLRLISVTSDQRPRDALEGMHPAQEGLIELLDEWCLYFEA